MPRKKIIALNINISSVDQAINDILELGQKRVPSFVCFVNAHMIIEAYWNKGLSEKINKARFLVPDGMSVTKSIKFLYKIDQERMPGIGSFPKLIKRAADKNLSIYLFGSTDDVLKKIKKRALEENPHLNITGTFSPSFDKPIDSESYINKINDASPHVVFVALGCPKQEKWMAMHSHKVNAVMLGVGGAFPVYAGIKKGAPDWMQRHSLEWFYRLCQEPGRLWKRYLVTNSMFILLILKQKAQLIFSKK